VTIHASAARGALRFPVNSLPEGNSIIESLAWRTDYREQCAAIKPRRAVRGLISCRLPADLFEGLRAAADEAIARYGLHGWLRQDGRDPDDQPSISLTYNPDLVEEEIADVHQSSLGSVRLPHTWPWSEKVPPMRKFKHTFFDGYGFRRLTPAARVGALGKFLGECRLSLIKSRIAVLRGSAGADAFATGWHCDEPVFENLRVNIPLRATPGYRLQLDSRARPDPRSRTMTEHYLRPGRAYSWDTRRLHRACVKQAGGADRVHLVLGFAPWFRYDARRDAWEPNEFFGRVHPFDILRSGGLHPALRLG